MTNVGDVVLVNSEHLGMYDVELEVVSLGDPNYLEFVGEHIIVKDENGNTFVARKGEYKPLSLSKDESNNNPEGIGLGDLIIPKERTNGTQKLFYYVIEKHEDGISYYNDENFRITTSFDKVEKARNEDVLMYIGELQNQIQTLRDVVVKTFSLIENDIKLSLQNYNK